MLRRVINLLLLVSLALVGAVSAQEKEATPEAELAKGIAYYEMGLMSPALTQFSKAIEMNKKYPEAYFWRGLALIEMNELNYAFATLTDALALRKEYPEAHYLLWLAMAQSGYSENPRALTALEAVAGKPVTLPRRMHLKLGEALADRGLIDRAVEQFQLAAKAKVPTPTIDSYFQQQLERNLEGIKGDINERGGNYATGHLKLARAFAEQRNFTEALNAAKTAIQQRENYPDAYLLLSSLYFLKQDYQSALDTLQNFLTKFPSDGRFPLFRSRIAVIQQAAGLPATPVVPNPDAAAKLTPPANLPVTAAARERKVSGAVTIEATFTGAGTIENPVVVQGLGHGLDERAIQAIMGMRFEPAQKDGKPVAVRQKVQVNFTL